MTTKTNKNNRLSIQFALDGFSFLVYNDDKLKIIEQKEVLYTPKEKFYDWLKVKLAGVSLFREKYTYISLLYSPEKYILVPKLFLEEEKQKELFMLSYPLDETEMIESEKIDDTILLSTINSDIYNLLTDYFPKANWQTTPLLLLKQLQSNKKWNIGALLLYNQLCIVVKKEEQVQLCNHFYFRAKDDLLYYILYTFDNLSIPVAESCIQLLGNQNYTELLAKELRRYHPHIIIPSSDTKHTDAEISMGKLLLSNL